MRRVAMEYGLRRSGRMRASGLKSSPGVRGLAIQDGRRGQRGKNGSAQRPGTRRRQPVQVRARIKNNSLKPVQNTGADGVAVQNPARREALGERCATIMAFRQQLTTALRRVSSGPGCWCRFGVGLVSDLVPLGATQCEMLETLSPLESMNVQLGATLVINARGLPS
jgi:hypothetical protein